MLSKKLNLQGILHANSYNINISTLLSRQFYYSTSSFSYSWDKKREQDPYNVLDLPRSASRREIKRKYYELVKIYHPDKLKDPTSNDQDIFKTIVAAYDLLYNVEKRNIFDRSGIGWKHSATGFQDVGHPNTRSNFDRHAWKPMRDEEWQRKYREYYQEFNYDSKRDEDLKELYRDNKLAIVGGIALIAFLFFGQFATSTETVFSNEADATRQEQFGNNLKKSRMVVNNLDREERVRLFLASRGDQEIDDFAIANELHRKAEQKLTSKKLAEDSEKKA